MSNKDETKGIIDEALGKVLPELYADIAKPSARRIGASLDTLFKVGLSPVSMLDWGFEYSKEWLLQKLEKRMLSIPKEFRCSPPNNIAVPAITHMSMSSDTPELRNLYAELLLKSMDSRSQEAVHPSYIHLVSQLSSQEALILVSFSRFESATLLEQKRADVYGEMSIEDQFSNYCKDLGFGHSELSNIWLENLQRMNVVVLKEYSEAVYREPDKNDPYVGVDNHFDRYLELTEYGKHFVEVCAPTDDTVA